MATNFPGSLDSFTNPSSSSTLDSPSHAAQHANINDSMEAVQAKLGVGAGTIGTYTATSFAFTSGVTEGNGTWEGAYARINELVHEWVVFTLGSTSAITGDINWDLVISPELGEIHATTDAQFLEGSNIYPASCDFTGSNVLIRAINTSGTYATVSNASATVPFTWATGDKIIASIVYRAA